MHALFVVRRLRQTRRHVEKSHPRYAAFKHIAARRVPPHRTSICGSNHRPPRLPWARRPRSPCRTCPSIFGQSKPCIVQRHRHAVPPTVKNRTDNRRADCTARTADMPSCALRESARWQMQKRATSDHADVAATSVGHRLTPARSELQPAAATHSLRSKTTNSLRDRDATKCAFAV